MTVFHLLVMVRTFECFLFLSSKPLPLGFLSCFTSFDCLIGFFLFCSLWLPVSKVKLIPFGFCFLLLPPFVSYVWIPPRHAAPPKHGTLNISAWRNFSPLVVTSESFLHIIYFVLVLWWLPFLPLIVWLVSPAHRQPLYVKFLMFCYLVVRVLVFLLSPLCRVYLIPFWFLFPVPASLWV